MDSQPRAAVLLIGNELLSGKVQDANLLVLAQLLRSLGVRLSRVVMVEDDRAVIAAEIRFLAATYDWVFTSGGVGPTHDDVTLESVALGFDVPLTRSGPIESLLRGFYGDRLTEGHLIMANLPEGTELVATSEPGEPAGRWPWPAMLMRNVFILPGIPQVFQMKLGAVRLKLKALGARPYQTSNVFTDMDEGHLKPLLDAVVKAHPDVEVGSYPAWFGADYRTKLTFDGLDSAAVNAAADWFCATLPAGEPKRREPAS